MKKCLAKIKSEKSAKTPVAHQVVLLYAVRPVGCAAANKVRPSASWTSWFSSWGARWPFIIHPVCPTHSQSQHSELEVMSLLSSPSATRALRPGKGCVASQDVCRIKEDGEKQEDKTHADPPDIHGINGKGTGPGVRGQDHFYRHKHFSKRALQETEADTVKT